MMWLVGSKSIRSNFTIPTTSFLRFFFVTNEVMCRALWHHLSSLPHQFSISEDVGGWQPWYRMNKTISKLYKTSTYQCIEGNIELLELPQVNNRPWNVLQLITTQTEPLQICEVKQLDRNAVYAWLSLQRKTVWLKIIIASCNCKPVNYYIAITLMSIYVAFHTLLL